MLAVRICAALSILASSLIWAAPHVGSQSLAARQSTDKLVFCHFIMGITDNRRSASDYDQDMQQAKAAGIDAFALNIGTDSFTDTQLTYAYQSATNNGMSVFISFDFNWFTTSQTSEIGQAIKAYGSQPSQLKVDGKVFISSFLGDGLDLDAVASASGYSRKDLFFAPNFQPANIDSADALFNWIAWPNNGNNKAPDASNNLTVSDGDQTYLNALKGKAYVAPVSPWFSTHFGLEVSYSKNFVFPSDMLWYQRWTEILTLGPQYLEIITWNDYGESSFVGSLGSPHLDDSSSKWVNDMPHDAFLLMARPYIAAFKAGSKTVDSHIESDQLIYWYRPTLKSATCDSTDTCGESSTPNPNYFPGKPNGYDTMQDAVFVIALLKSAGTVTVTSGTNTETFNAQAGPNAFQILMSPGKQSFSLTRGGQTVLSGDSLKDIISDCVCGIYNFNAYAGSLPAGPSDPLQPDGLKSFALGLSATCQATPSLGIVSGADAAAAAFSTATIKIASANSLAIAPSTSAAPDASSLLVSNSSANPISSSTATSVTTQAQVSTSIQQPTTTTAAVVVAGGSKTITALSQLAPTNCMHQGYEWAGPTGTDPPAYCDGG